MKVIRILIRVIMLLGTLVVATGAILLGIFFSSPTGFFGASWTFDERFEGYKFLAIGAMMILFSFSLFRRKNLVPFLTILGTVILGLFSFGKYINQDTINVVGPYIIGMTICYILDFLVGKKIPEETKVTNKEKERKLNKILIGVPIVLLIAVWWYVNFGFYWWEQIGNANSQKSVMSNLNYQMYTTRYIPTGYKLRETRLGGVRSDYFYAEYRNSQQKYFMLAQFRKSQNVYLKPPRCSIYGDRTNNFEIMSISGTSSGINSSCVEIITPKGLKVYLMSFQISEKENFAATVIGDTLITISGYDFSQPELIKLIDSLEAKNPKIKAPNMKEYE